MATTMEVQDTVSGKLAECYITIDGKRYNFMNMLNLECKFEKTKQEISILGKTGKANKSTGWKGTFTGKMHYNNSKFRQMMLDFNKKGVDVYFTMQVTNNDESSNVGKQTVIFQNCNIDGGILAKFDAESDSPLDEDISGTFEDFDIETSFTAFKGMES